MLSQKTAARFGCLLASALIFAGSASAEPSSQIIDGRTSIRLATEFLDLLDANGFEMTNILPGGIFPTETPPRVSFPVPTGEFDEAGPEIEIVHYGGMLLTAGNTSVAITTLIMDSFNIVDGKLNVTGIVKSNDSIVGRGTLFRITLSGAPQVTPESGSAAGRVVITDGDVRLTGTGANSLNAAAGLTGVFTSGMRIGTANISVRFRDRDG